MLIPWADCVLWCRDNQAEMIAPFWTRVRIGPWLRRERDKRLYHRYFVSAGKIHGLRRLALLATSSVMSAEDWRGGRKTANTNKNIVVRFSDMNLFGNLIGRHEEIRAELYRMTRPKFHPTGLTGAAPFVGIHIRFGDFPSMSPGGSGAAVYFRLPIDWYTGCLLEIRRAIGFELPAIVFSDGSDAELGPLLALRAVARSPFQAAITDMLALAESSAIITSRSTFSLWGAYLGQVPSIWYPNKADVCGNGVFADKSLSDLEIEWMTGRPLPDAFASALTHRIQHKAQTQ
jgi:hypothetical protein